MSSNALCPISHKTINERVARLNAGFTVLLLLAFALTESLVPVIFLSIDFLLRASDFSKYSLVGIASRRIVQYLPVDKVEINAGPKIFAARIGFVLSAVIVGSVLLGFPVLTLILTGMLGLFSFLESAFGICVACEIYPFVYKLFYKGSFQRI